MESRRLGAGITLLGLVGLAASAVLTLEHLAALDAEAAGTEFSPVCDLGSVVSCSTAIASPASTVFGFPSALLGLVGFTAVVALGAVLWLGSRVPRPLWFALQAGVTLAIVFATWLQYQSIVVIGALCPYCMVVWAATIPLFVLVSRATARLVAPESALARFLTNWSGLVIVLWYLAVGTAILFRFAT